CLLASTGVSAAAARTNDSTEVTNDSYGWGTITSSRRSSGKMSGEASPRAARAGAVPCTRAPALSSGRAGARGATTARVRVEARPVERLQMREPRQVQRDHAFVDLVLFELQLAHE